MSVLLTWLMTNLGPIIASIIKALLERAIQKTGPDAQLTPDNVRRVFKEARTELGFLSFRKRALMGACERLALKRTGAFAAAASGLTASVEPLTADEVADLAASLNL